MLLLHSRASRAYTRTSAAFLVELRGNFRMVNVLLTCTITHRCEVKGVNGQVVIPKDSTTVVTIQGSIGRYTKNDEYYHAFVPQNPPQLPQGLPVLAQKIPIVLDFGWPDHVIDTRTFDIPINPGWFGEIQVALGTGTNRIASRTILLGERSWGLPSTYGSAIPPLRQLQELASFQGMPQDVQESLQKVRRWLQDMAPRATYPVRANNGIKFYNDASENARGTAGAFHDLYNAMQDAQHFIFIADWSFHPDTYLLRPAQGPDDDDKIGRILINKARQDANIVIAIHTWNHLQNLFISDDLPNNNASAILNQMSGGQRPGNLLWRATERPTSLGIKSHHQKFVVLDTPVLLGGGVRREIKVFFGGLDLTTGRFDWSAHPIDDPHNTFKPFEDWYNPEFTKYGPQELLASPRQPWHDIYAQLVGPTAWDFIFEFVGRWSVGAPGVQSVTALGGDADEERRVLKKFEALLSDNTFVRPFDPLDRQPRRSWTAQVYRSMEKNFWHKPDLQGIQSQMAPGFLQWGLHKDYEKSIHKAYLQAIQRAEKFIYIETQYLIAGEYCTETTFKAEKRNHIPKALINRIVEKHTNNQDFHVYILLPLFPEGVPDAIPPRPVRYFQWQTIREMKNELVQRLQSHNNGKTWEDYLSFYFLGNRTNTLGANHATSTRRRDKVRAGNRYMIYVHSKMMIVDDAWIIIGSANLNERSMSGSMDSEICVGMWASPGHEATCLQAIRTFRKKLWDEHLGQGFCTQNPPQNLHNFNADNPQEPHTYRAVQAAALSNLNDFVNGTTLSNPQNSINHLMLWDFNAQNFAIMPIPDSRDISDAWLVQPILRGGGGGLPNAGFL